MEKKQRVSLCEDLKITRSQDQRVLHLVLKFVDSQYVRLSWFLNMFILV